MYICQINYIYPYPLKLLEWLFKNTFISIYLYFNSLKVTICDILCVCLKVSVCHQRSQIVRLVGPKFTWIFLCFKLWIFGAEKMLNEMWPVTKVGITPVSKRNNFVGEGILEKCFEVSQIPSFFVRKNGNINFMFL